MYSFNTTQKVLKNFGRIKGHQSKGVVISPYCEGACCQMISSSSSIPMTINNKFGISGNTLPFLKEECSHFETNSNNGAINGISSFLFRNKNSFFTPCNRLYGTLSHSNGNNNQNTFLYKAAPSTSILDSYYSSNQNFKSPFKNNYNNLDFNSNYTTSFNNNNNNIINLNSNNKNHNKINNHNHNHTHNINNYFGTLNEPYQNCVKFESNKSNYVLEIIEGILPKDLVSGSKMLTPNEPHSIFVNFSSAVKAYQAHQYITEWSEKNSTNLKSNLIRTSLDPLHSIEKTNIEKLPEYPVPNYQLFKSEPSIDIIQNKLLGGVPISNFNEKNQITLSFFFEYIHKDDIPENYDYYVITLSNGDNTMVFDIKSIGHIPKVLIEVLNSPNIAKVGFNNHRQHIHLFENQYNLKINNFEDLSKHPIILRSKPRNLTSVVGIFLKYKLPRLEINRFSHGQLISHLFSEKKIEHYAQITDSVHSLANILKSQQPDFFLSFSYINFFSIENTSSVMDEDLSEGSTTS
ncbi:hypothetical protein DICPUDRAFT_156094 [Dictyostelium purpureum]|uniref:3'-5' exonuclease domain-containing protein n=1 Tax=Dictyostelium purpureum TaxID=5786 RepID=F0ZVP6_DICPU|nr:uncharacterized protein DICPUDRAFT_156094 [Dictyostelium purpureum]EGC31985.1 hypothetical protein DICPUDRAFT_156094 [Dictyostelium purpureum]|eukprot:XP_003291483.1 hypothetical protein DICPUDRAFT_156094 [Dictyostelium purpureum]